MGDCSFETHMIDEETYATHECFQLKLENVKFEHAQNYRKWKDFVMSQRKADMGVPASPLEITNSSAPPTPTNGPGG